MYTRYVVGFAFDAVSKGADVLLIEKKRPKWMAGLWNGIGGKIEEGETKQAAMNRECLEETGLVLDWEEYARMKADDYSVYVFRAFGDIGAFEQKEDEELAVTDTGRVLLDGSGASFTVPNVPYLVAMALSGDNFNHITIDYRSSRLVTFPENTL